MAERKYGTVIHRHALSPHLEIFRIAPAGKGDRFPPYVAGQYIALSRENCKLTRRIVDEHGKIRYVPDLDESGARRRGKVTHSYSIASAPFETEEHGYLEFYVVLEMVEFSEPGRLSESLFHLDPETDNRLYYVDKITGDFTLERRARGYADVVMVGTGTGIAPFASMLKQLQFEALHGKMPPARYTLFHANRTREELGYHEDFLRIAKAGNFDFVYVPSVSRPSQETAADPQLGSGRANNVLRSVLGMATKEEEECRGAAHEGNGGDSAAMQAALEKVVAPALPARMSAKMLAGRMDPPRTVVLTCGNSQGMADIKTIAERNHFRFEKEDW